MIPKGKILALLLAFTAVGGLAATGAFTTVQAERTADVETTGDADALLGLEAIDDTEFAENDGGTLEISAQDESVNNDAVTLDDNVINVTNRGNDEVTLSATLDSSSDRDSGDLAFYVAQSELNTDSSTTGDAKVINALNNTPDNLDGDNRFVIDSEPDGVVLGPGDSVTVGLYLNTEGITSNDTQLFASSDAATFTANATDDTDDRVLVASSS
jgi:hypothetical protein